VDVSARQQAGGFAASAALPTNLLCIVLRQVAIAGRALLLLVNTAAAAAAAAALQALISAGRLWPGQAAVCSFVDVMYLLILIVSGTS